MKIEVTECIHNHSRYYLDANVDEGNQSAHPEHLITSESTVFEPNLPENTSPTVSQVVMLLCNNYFSNHARLLMILILSTF